jgi:hypothetical protein
MNTYGFYLLWRKGTKGIFKMACLYKLMMNETTFWNSEFIRLTTFFGFDIE